MPKALASFHNKIQSALIGLLLIGIAPGIAHAKKKVVPAAPLPGVISQAKRVFLTNGGGSQLAFDEFYSQMKQWGRFQIVGSPAEADIVIELRYAVADKGPRYFTSTNTYTNQTQLHSVDVVDPQLFLAIYDASSRALLWSDSDHRRLARLERNREKETIKSADRLVEQLQARMSQP
jgi:hypothetical protein